ncbi:hypothetical protein F4808DRAFT_439173 [Astrocystis sublimbata]|nr:hypothetical protein F4808DRAFT_439173 [Astrocystis sublimbata]
MTITRLFQFAVADEARQDFAVKTFTDLKNTCKKDGAPYLVAAHGAKIKVIKDTAGGPAWTVYASLTFKDQADADYFEKEDPVSAELRSKNTDMHSAMCVLEGSFTQ